jgi:hypothetical protein
MLGFTLLQGGTPAAAFQTPQIGIQSLVFARNVFLDSSSRFRIVSLPGFGRLFGPFLISLQVGASREFLSFLYDLPCRPENPVAQLRLLLWRTIILFKA